jgi:hypothetical protein
VSGTRPSLGSRTAVQSRTLAPMPLWACSITFHIARQEENRLDFSGSSVIGVPSGSPRANLVSAAAVEYICGRTQRRTRLGPRSRRIVG